MVTLLATVTISANNTNNIIKRDASKTSLVIKNVKEGNLLTIKDKHGITLYKELIETSGLYKKGFDLTELPSGDYIFELEKDFEVKTIPFTVALNKVYFNQKNEVISFKPLIRQVNELVYLSQLNPNFKETTIKVFAINNNETKLRFSEKTNKSQVIEKVFKLEKGNYKIVTSFDNKEYTTYINN